MTTVVAQTSRNGRKPSTAQQADGRIAQSRHDFGTIVCMNGAAIFSHGHIFDVMQAVFNSPMISDQGEHAWWGSLLHREAAESIDHLMARLVGFEQACRAFEPEDLLDAFPVLGKPVIEIRATGDLTVLEPPMPFVPGLSLLPTTPIG